jgi:predicted AlkP superfamily phosphohydrolase/phosphomutase
MSKVFVLGLDGAPPELIFEIWKDELPNINSLMKEGTHARLASTIPPSTIVAWSTFCSGQPPGNTGVYSYTKRINFNYKADKLISSQDISCEMIWDILAKHNKKSIVFHIPLTYPVKKINGIMLSDFLTPELNDSAIYPKEVKDEITQLFGSKYMFDVDVGLASYKSMGKEELIEKIFRMTDMNFKLINHFIDTKEWDLFIIDIIGTDRIEHTFFRYFDKTHRNYTAGNEFEQQVLDYFKFIDTQVGKLKKKFEASQEDITFIVASDHGMAKMDGRINLNDWLINNGYLVLKTTPSEPQKLDFNNVDWSKTKAFAVGAYFGRLYFNLKGREPEGIVTEEEYESLQGEISTGLSKLRTDEDKEMTIKFFKAQDVFQGKYQREAPDLIIYFDNLIWGVNNDVGNLGLHSYKTTKGSDDAGHSPEGIFIMHGQNVKSTGLLPTKKLLDMTPTILKKLDIPIPSDLEGEVIE